MMPSPNNVAIIAAAGSAKTQYILNQVLAHPERQALITTYTTENLDQILTRLCGANGGTLPPHVTVMGWFTFLVNQCVRPYQRAVMGAPNFISGFNFRDKRMLYARKEEPHVYFLDAERNVYRDGAADLAVQINKFSEGAVVNRLGDMFDDIYIDELQDLAGWDLNFVEALFQAPVRVTAVGDPRQQTFVTNTSTKNKSAKGDGLVAWLEARSTYCKLEVRDECHRCNQAICDFADALYPDLPPTISLNTDVTGHDGIMRIAAAEVPEYCEKYSPQILRYQRTTNTLGLPAKNFGLSKGSTYDRVLIFPTKPMLTYLQNGDLSKVGDVAKFYVAVTRARFSVAFVV